MSYQKESQANRNEKPKKENILELNQYIGQKIMVKFNGGREVIGVLRGYDTLVNLVLDECLEFLRDTETFKVTNATRKLGLVVCKGSAVMCVFPAEGTEEIDNPYADAEEGV
eukprot:TRINITY_DN10892_c0_g1_i2.p1 TRINITY_DN10892_c0_g1~~TRINITY_DN10892_c0_g1_i2.p1  ORF type:complete len:112 (-),score=30.23 TRINITY_DN10892_c0_g1_i2:290-625(-)